MVSKFFLWRQLSVLIASLFFGFAILVCCQESFAVDKGVILDRERDKVRQEPLSQPIPAGQEEESKTQTQFESGTFLTLQSLSVTGSSVYSQEELIAPYKDLLGKQISYEHLQKISREMTKKYRDAGYILSRVILPSQEANIDGANINFIAIEGFIDSIEYSGDNKVLNRFKSYFEPIEKRLLSKKPLKHSDLERYMLLMKDVSGIDISSRFERGKVSGGSKLHIDVQSKLIDGSINFGNTGTEETGPILGSVSVGLNTLPLIGNRTTVTYTQALDVQEYHSIQIANRYQFWNGFAINVSYAYSASPEMDSEFAQDFDYSTNSTTWNLGVNYPILRSRDINLLVGLNYEQRNSDSYLMDGDIEEHFKRDRLRSLSGSINFDFADRFGGITQFITTVSRGLNILSATDESYRSTNTFAPAEYWKFDIFASRDQQLPYNFSIYTSAEAQFSTESLSSYNKFSYGGSQFGRGYEPGVIEGDNAFAFTVEPRWTMYPTDSTTLQFFSFFDYGSIWNTEDMRTESDQEYGTSAGLGVRYFGHIGNSKLPDFKLSTFVAQPLRPCGDNNADAPRLVLQGALFF